LVQRESDLRERERRELLAMNAGTEKKKVHRGFWNFFGGGRMV